MKMFAQVCFKFDDYEHRRGLFNDSNALKTVLEGLLSSILSSQPACVTVYSVKFGALFILAHRWASVECTKTNHVLNILILQ